MDITRFKNEYPFSPKTFTVDGHKLSFLDEGNGEPVVMLHGNPTWSFYYRKLALALRDEHRVVVPDHIGCGLSDKPQDYDYTLKSHIDNFSALAENLKLNSVTLALHDWGGAIGMGWAVKNPEKVKRIVLFNTAAFLSPCIPPSIAVCRLPLIGEIIVRGFNGFLGAAVGCNFATAKPERFTPEVRAGYMEPYSSWADRVAIHRFVKDIPMSPNVPSYSVVKSIEENLHTLTEKPILIIWGMKDFCFNDHFLNRWTELFPKAELHKMEDAGHWVVEDSHEEIIPLLEKFIENN